MKKHFKNLLYTGIVLTVLHTSCVPLDVEPLDRDTDLNYWKKPYAAYETLNNCYIITSAEEVFYADAMTDNAYTKVSNDFTQAIGNSSYATSDKYVKAVWDSRYAAIRNCNLLLNNIDKVPGLSDALRNRYIAEATTLRAYLFYDLYSRFGDVPYPTKVLTYNESRTIGRTSKAEVLNNILSDLSRVIDNNLLPPSYSGDDTGRMTRWAAMAIKARVLLFEGRFAEVKPITEKIISEGGFELYPSYENLFTVQGQNCKEVIFDLQYLHNKREYNTQYHFLPPSLGGHAQLAPLQELVDDYITIDGHPVGSAPSGSYNPAAPFDNRDPRLAATIAYTGNFYTKSDGTKHYITTTKGADPDGYGYSSDASPTGYYFKKYWDNTYRASFYSGLNIILIRYADVLLMQAEAAEELGQLNATVWDKTIKPIRQRAGFTDANAINFPAGGNLKDIVRRERRCELAFEGLRHKDIFRWKTAENVMKGWCHGLKTGDVIGADNGFVRIENRSFDPAKHYLWPIPQFDRDLNGNLTKNPNW